METNKVIVKETMVLYFKNNDGEVKFSITLKKGQRWYVIDNNQYEKYFLIERDNVKISILKEEFYKYFEVSMRKTKWE